jgi:membrane protein YqaA with SNARE-associated domain
VQSFIKSVYGLALSLGGPGLFVVAFLDSSFISLPQINDLLVVLMVLRNKPLMPYYAAMATLGSVAGCYVLYLIAERGGEAFLAKRLHAGHTERALALYRRRGVLALMIPAILPPPAPFKLFVLLAGVSGLAPVRFALTIALGRGLRYFGIGLLTLWYGPQTLAFLETNGRTVAYWLAGIVVAGALVALIWRQFRRRQDVLTSPTRADIIL